MGVVVLDEIKAISAQLGLGFGLSLAKLKYCHVHHVYHINHVAHAHLCTLVWYRILPGLEV